MAYGLWPKVEGRAMIDNTTDKDELRKRAEARLADEGGGIPGQSLQDSRELIQELRTHQIELEMQNEALRQSELEISEAHDRYVDLYDFAPIGYITINDAGMITQANLRMARMLGVERRQLMLQRFASFIDRADQDGWYKHRKAVLASGDIQTVELRMNRATGTGLDVRMETTLRAGTDGNHLLMAISDISERKLAEEKILELAQAIEQVGEGIILTDVGATIEYVNRAFTQVTGYTAEEAVGNNPRMLHSGRQNADFYKQMWVNVKKHGLWQGKVWNKRKNGEIYPEQLSINTIRSSNGSISHYCGIFSDCSEQLSLEQKLQQAQKMEAIGTLVGGIAHDFNNMLAAITGGLFLARRELHSLPDDAAKRIEDVETQCFRAADLIKQLLAFARKETVHMMPFDLTAFIKEIFKLNKVSIPENIQLNNIICNERLVIEGDATQMQQIVLNLLTNARDAVAFADKPSISLSLTSYQADHDFLHRHPELDGEHFARLSVIDNGYGIPEQNLERLFEPYFTTKEVGKGSGLGLAMIYGAVQTHRGGIEVESKVNQGSSFHIYLPIYHGEYEVADNTVDRADGGKGETVLLVDDESSVRIATADVLESLGYIVITAENGREAVALFDTHGTSIDLVILDIVMPDMGGEEAARRMRRLNPDVPVIFSTGYDLNHVLSDSDRLSNSMQLVKPTPVPELSRAIRSMLNS